jgi:sugar phosphate permease
MPPAKNGLKDHSPATASQGTTDVTKTGLSDVGQRASRRVAYRLLPFVFLLYIINYIDRVNVSFANLRMSADLGFSGPVYGLGVGMFYLTYVLFEIPGAIIVERWSARKWIARIMISCGIVTILTGLCRLPDSSMLPASCWALPNPFFSRHDCLFDALVSSARSQPVLSGPSTGYPPS